MRQITRVAAVLVAAVGLALPASTPAAGLPPAPVVPPRVAEDYRGVDLKLVAPWPGGAPAELVVVGLRAPSDERPYARVSIDRVGEQGAPRVLLDRPARSVRRANLVDVTGDGRGDLILLVDGACGRDLIVIDLVPVPPVPILATRVRSADVLDVDGDGRVEVVGREPRGDSVAVVPVVYRMQGGRLKPSRERTAGFYRSHEELLCARIARADAPTVADRAVDMLDLALFLETFDRGREAFAIYRRVVETTGVPTRVDRDEAARLGGLVELAREARQGMARVVGLRTLADPRPSPPSAPGASPGPGTDPGPAPSSSPASAPAAVGR